MNNPLSKRMLAVLLTLAMIAGACGGGSDGDDASTTDDVADGTGGDDGSGSDDGGDGGDDGGSTDSSGTDSGGDAADPARFGGTLRVGFEADPSGLNPTISAMAPGAILMSTAIFETLTVWDENDTWQNNLTESWTPNADFTVWEVKLREGITFHDGEPFNTDAVLHSLSAQLTDPLIGLALRPVFNESLPFEKIDEFSFIINTSEPNAQLPTYFTTQLGFVGSTKWIEEAKLDPALHQLPVGVGPFKIESRVQDSMTRVVRNDDWWRDEPIYLDAIEFFPLQQESTRYDQLLSGDFDMAHATDADNIFRMRDEPDFLNIEDDDGEEFLIMFNAQKAPFDDIRVRQAATHLFPRQEYEDFIQRGTTIPANSMFAPGSKWHAAGLDQQVDSPELAAPLIAAYCADVPESCTDGKVNIEFQHNGPSISLDNTFTLIKASWDAGFNITLQVIPQDVHVNEVAFGLFDAATWRYHGQIDPEVETLFFSCSTITAISINFARNCNEERDALMSQQRGSTDEAERIALWQEIQADINDSRHYLWINHTRWIVSGSENVRDVCAGTTPDGQTLRCTHNGKWYTPQIWLEQ
ncbi:MAG: hypothetical protein HKN94_12470 [Acidimicrobiales bacterium]|nr:hypothetical protein [Acidimicrobiales bacterium]RZV47668.1 MAG: hypothetical protein EX269_04295 [Acidimicrobiales bacterium]